MLRRIATPFGIALVGLVLFELVLRLLALGAPHWLARTPGAGGGGAFRVLCIGDSHTYGWGVERSEAYPARLEQLLKGGVGADVEVVNLGVPSSNSSQVVTRLPRYLARYRPQLLIVTVGANDVSNFAEREEARGPRSWLWRLRSWRLLVYALHQRRKVEAGRTAGIDVSWSHPWVAAELRDGAFRERFEHRVDLDAMLGEAEHEALLRDNLEQIVRIAAGAAVPVVFASYTHDLHSLAVSNRVMAAVMESTAEPGILFVSQRAHSDLRAYVSRAPDEPEEPLFFEDLHPKANVHAAAAAHLRDELLRAGLLPR